ncbi:AraC family transcriptional regulator [Paenibacillus oryzisoli]|uniref:helix-turn-helix domain-containing protein n=1 Tax=Paenibacillus oryzisoli TaxID=1850517 RepID=UPI003D2D2F14
MFKPKLFTKYMISYTALFFIPVLILAFLAFSMFNSILNKEITSNTSVLLEQAKNSIDNRVEELNKLSIQISNNPYLSSSSIANKFTDVVFAINLLKNFSIPNNFFDNFFIYYFGHELLYSPKGTFNPQYFSSVLYPYEDWKLEDLQKQLNASSNIYVKPIRQMSGDQTVQKSVLYAVPIPYMSEKPSGAVFFLIQEKTIYDILKETLNANKSSVLILDSASKPITMMGALTLDSIDPDQFEHRKSMISEKIVLGGSSYFVSSTTSTRSGWTYISFLPTDTVTNKLSGLKTTTLILFLTLFIIGVLLIYAFMKMNYKPLGELSRLAASLLGKDQSNPGGIESVKTAVDQMSKQITVLEGKYQSTSPIMRQRLLHQLLKGHFTDTEEFTIAGAEYGLSISGQFFSVVIVMLDAPSTLSPQLVGSRVQSLFADWYSGFVLDDVVDDQIILVLSDENNHVRQYEDICATMIDKLQSELQLSCTVGVGNWFPSLSSLSESYLQACSALDYRLIKGKNTVISYREIESNQKNAGYYPKQQLELLETYFTDHNADRFTQVLDAIFKNMKEKRIPLMSAKLLCYDVIQTIEQAIYKNNYYLKNDEDSAFDIISLSRYETLEDLSDRIKALCSDIFNAAREEQPMNKQMEKIKEYTLQNYHECHFSLQGLSDHMNMSVSYLSHYFKAQEGRNISDYVNDLRMHKAKTLLTDTPMNLQQVAYNVGYMNLSSFIRKFKQTTGVTPGVFRDTIKEKDG